MLDSASFDTLLENIPAILLIHLRHSCYIPSTLKYILGIPAAFCFNSWTLEPYSASILTAFVQHSRHLPTELQALFGQQSNCSYLAFEVHSEHYDSVLNIPTVFHTTCDLHSSDTFGMRRII